MDIIRLLLRRTHVLEGENLQPIQNINVRPGEVCARKEIGVKYQRQVSCAIDLQNFGFWSIDLSETSWEHPVNSITAKYVTLNYPPGFCVVGGCIWEGGGFNAARKFEGSEGEIHLSICNLDKAGSLMSVFQLGSSWVAPKVIGVAPGIGSDTARGTLACRVFKLGPFAVFKRLQSICTP